MATDDRSPFRVLIIDDEPPVRDYVSRVLQRAYDVRVAADAQDALRLAEHEGPFDLLVVDVTMPDMPGDEVARRLRQSHPDLKILYLTGYADQLFESRGMLWADEAFLEKPATPQALLEAVSLLLVGSVPKPRATRVHIPSARLHLANIAATLETLSVTGALVTAPDDVPVGSTWPVILELPTEMLHLGGRVVSCETVGPHTLPAPSGIASGYRVAVAFVDTRPDARRALQRLCDGPAVARV